MNENNKLNIDCFPKDFLWGVSTSAYQIEGAVHADGRGESIWDRFSHTPGKIIDGSSGDVAVDHYHLYASDVQLLQDLGVNAYRFSVAWPRIVPSGVGAINEAGLDFYDRLVDALLEACVTPFITLYHWDLPQKLQDSGGWPNRDTAFAFLDYARAVYTRLGDRVEYWTTHNEMWCTAFLGYHVGRNAPGIQDFEAALAASHHVLLSHGLVVQMLRNESKTPIKIGVAPNLEPAYPASSKPRDVQAAWRYDGFFNRWFLDPLSGRGYPGDMWQYYGDLVPDVQDDDMNIISTPVDFLGVNYYSAVQIEADPNGDYPHTRKVPNAALERTADREIDTPWLYGILKRLDESYSFPEYFITENGAAFDDQLVDGNRVHDQERVSFLKAHFQEAQKAVIDGIPLKGYFVWSLMDNFEWSRGYSLRYGIYYVDFHTQGRFPKDSAIWYRAFLKGK